MAEFVYHAYFQNSGPPVPENGTLYMEVRSAVSLDVGPIRQMVLASGFKNLVDGSALQTQNLVVVPITGIHLTAVNANKATGPSKQDQSFETWAQWKTKMQVHNNQIFTPAV